MDLFRRAATLAPATSHTSQVFAAVGGVRTNEADVSLIREEVRSVAVEFGFPAQLQPSLRLPFDRSMAESSLRIFDLTWSEAASRDVWSFVALVLLPDVTRWRWSESSTPLSAERWIASDLTRHTWSRYWWRATTFSSDPGLLNDLHESDLNQILERRAIGGDPRLAIIFSQQFVVAERVTPGHRRRIIRESALRLLRRLAFVDARSLTDADLEELCRTVMEETIAHLPTS